MVLQQERAMTSERTRDACAHLLAAERAPAIVNAEELIVPAIVIYEVYKAALRERGKDAANDALSGMLRGRIIELTPERSVEAALLSHDLKLPMADSIILATAQKLNATLWTQDAHFQGIAGVRFYAKK